LGGGFDVDRDHRHGADGQQHEIQRQCRSQRAIADKHPRLSRRGQCCGGPGARLALGPGGVPTGTTAGAEVRRGRDLGRFVRCLGVPRRGPTVAFRTNVEWIPISAQAMIPAL
ncbi:MAG: hypothetical protein K1000chlam4_00065, partial [Chlamydiae bacterium]|nr:hypothetical protein [Chlamydiota bacterium]